MHRPPVVSRHRRRHWGRWLLAVLLAAATLSVGLGVDVGWTLTHPARKPLASNPALWGMAYQRVRFSSRLGHLSLRGWWIPARSPKGLTVVFAHGYASNRQDSSVPLLAVAAAVHAMGANVLMFDFRGEGRSPGHLVSVGYYEKWDLLGAVQFAHRQDPAAKIAVMGYSMGASTAVLTAAQSPLVAAVVADSPFDNLASYLQHHLSSWTHLPAFPFNPIILGILPRLTGVYPRKVDPLGVITKLGRRPLLLIAGTGDTLIPDSNSEALYQKVRATDPNAQLWLVPGASHIQAFKVAPIEYARKVYQIFHEIDSKVLPPSSTIVW